MALSGLTARVVYKCAMCGRVLFLEVLFQNCSYLYSMKLPLPIALAQFIVSCSAKPSELTYKEIDYVAYSCMYTLSSTAAWCSSDLYGLSCYCTDDNAMGSFLYCVHEFLETKNPDTVEEWVYPQCANSTVEGLKQIYENSTNYMVNTSEVPGFNISVPVDFPVYVNATMYQYNYMTYNAFWGNLKHANFMGAGAVAYWGLVFLCGTISSMMHRFAPRLTLSLNKKSSQLWIVRWYRKNVSLPAAFGTVHTKRNFALGLLPTRLESLIIFGFFVMVLLFQAVNIKRTMNNTFFPEKVQEISRYVGDRSGVIANYLMTLTYLLAGRNQIFMWLTGWKQSTFMTYHKWVGRFLFLTVFTHTISMLMYTYAEDAYEYYSGSQWWRYGAAATVAGGTMFLQAFSWLREKNYEVFLYVHIAMAIVFLLGAWKHIEIFDYQEWAYATLAIWAFDRVVRLVRIFSFGVKTAKVCIVSNETLQVTVDRGSWWPFFPGAFGYVHFLKTSIFWQSHPFTVCKTDNNELRLYIKIKRGVTEILYKQLLNEPNYTGEVKIAVEGPYGDKKPAKSYEQVLLYSGGNGIPGPYAYAKELGVTANTQKTQFVKLYWVIRHWNSLDWSLEELQALQKYTNIQTVIYVTKAHEVKFGDKLLPHFEPSCSSSSIAEKDSAVAITSAAYNDVLQKVLPHIEFREGRPVISDVVREDIEDCQDKNTALITCGHSDMCDEIRQVIAVKVGDHKTSRIDLFEELQTW